MSVHISSAAGRIPRPTALSRFRPYAAALLLLSVGCFTYNGVPRGEATPGRDVEIDLNPSGRAALAKLIGPQVRTVAGRLDAVDTSGVTIAIAKTTVVEGDDNSWHGEKVQIPYPFIDQVGERTLSKGKTIALIALVAGAVSGLVILLGRATSTTVEGGVPGHIAQ